ncbi:MAG: anion transporter, partial [Deltaproteobacteria bacterium]|nr:anion transporter [Deltaproteobacteria bacterium]
ERCGFFQILAGRIIAACRTPQRLLTVTAFLSGGLSALLVNDTVCLFLTPVVVSACIRARLPMGPYLIALATSANIGSAATIVGNPQNMIIGSMSGISFSRFLSFAGPAALTGLLINALLLHLYYSRRLPEILPALPNDPEGPSNGYLGVTILVTAGIIAGFFAGFHLAYTTLAGVMVLVLIQRKDPRDVFSAVDWSLLVFFCCLFIVVAGLAGTGIIQGAWDACAPRLSLSTPSGVGLFTALMTLGSNLVSNVPMVLLTGPHLGILGSGDLGWILLAYSTTVAGNLTLLGSVANIIVAEGAREHHALGFFEYLRFGLVSTLLVLPAGITVIYLLGS